MPVDSKRALTFHLAGVAFIVSLDEIVEVVEDLQGLLDFERRDLGQGIVCALSFRRAWIPAIDPALRLGLVHAAPLPDRVALVLHSVEGVWALLADRIGPLLGPAKLTPCDVPPLLKKLPGLLYSQILLAEGTPFVVFEPKRFYGFSQGAA
ncbi:MAG: hypothetical protein R6W66_12020 [Pelovirga sp.]